MCISGVAAGVCHSFVHQGRLSFMLNLSGINDYLGQWNLSELQGHEKVDLLMAWPRKEQRQLFFWENDMCG